MQRLGMSLYIYLEDCLPTIWIFQQTKSKADWKCIGFQKSLMIANLLNYLNNESDRSQQNVINNWTSCLNNKRKNIIIGRIRKDRKKLG